MFLLLRNRLNNNELHGWISNWAKWAVAQGSQETLGLLYNISVSIIKFLTNLLQISNTEVQDQGLC